MKLKLPPTFALLLISCYVNLVFGQTQYVCRNKNGSAFASNRPCTSSGDLVYYGPMQTNQTYSTYIPKVSDAPTHLKYLSPRCSSLNDAIRTAPVRGLKSDTTASLYKEYRKECAEDESAAYSRMNADMKEEAESKKLTHQKIALSQQDMQLKKQQCDESKRIIVTKRKRSDLTDGERSDLARFEDNYKVRCD